MSSVALERERHHENYLNVAYTLKSWLTTVDHKRIGILYMISVTLFFFLGGLAAVLFRLELLTPQADLVEADTYNKLFTLHGIIMVWFFMIPSIPNVLGNFLIPIMIGARDLAFPRLNLASWYVFMFGGLLTFGSVILGGVDTGWTFYVPYSTVYSNSAVTLVAIGVFITGFSSIMTGVNFIVTVHKMRAPGMGWWRLPLFVWSNYANSLILVLGTPVLAIVLVLLALERLLGIGVFDPARGGDPILYQHLFWFYSHPAVYLMVLPPMGTVSEIIAAFTHRRIFGYRFVALASLGIAVIGFLVWGHHMFTAGQSSYASVVFSGLSFLVAIPSAIKVFNWTASLYKGNIWFATPMLYALGFIGLFTIGGLTGLYVASTAVDVHVHDTYFVVAHFHYIMVGASVMAYIGGVHYWWPKISGKMYSEWWGRASAILIFAGFNLTFFPQFLLGYEGMPRRYQVYVPEYQVLNVMSTAGASILAVGYVLPLIYLLLSLRFGQQAVMNPWGASGLEWTIPSPPPTENFEEIPVIEHEAYTFPEGVPPAWRDEALE